MTASVIPLPFKGDLIDYLQLNGRKLECLWRDHEAFIPVRPICDQLNVAWQPQHRKITSPDFEGCVTIMVTQDTIGRAQEMVCLAYPDFMVWLSNLTVSKVKPEAQEALRHLKREIKTLIATYYRERLFGEVVMRDQAAVSFELDWSAARSWRHAILTGCRGHWTFQQIRGAAKPSVPGWRIAEDIRNALRLGLIDWTPPDLPAPRTVLEAAPEPSNDPRQMPLFGEG